MKTFLQKLNLRLILIHFVAFWLFICAFKVLFYLKDFAFLHDIAIGRLKRKQIDANRLSTDLLWFELSAFIGLLIAFTVSLRISIKNHWHWLNALIAFIVCFLFARLQHSIGVYNPSFYFNYLLGTKLDLFYIFIISSVIMLSVAFVLLFSRRTIRFINAGISSSLMTAQHTDQ
jgi:hypothetical protein